MKVDDVAQDVMLPIDKSDMTANGYIHVMARRSRQPATEIPRNVVSVPAKIPVELSASLEP